MRGPEARPGRLDELGPAGFEEWHRGFVARRGRADPAWRPAELPVPLARSLARFQLGEGSDGAGLIGAATAAGDGDYLAAARLFVAEEQDHARLLGRLLAVAGRPTVAAHWSDSVFRLLRRRAGVSRELMVLMVAEVCALRYYRAVRDGAADPLAREVAARVLADEEQHVPFHVQRLRVDLAARPAAVRAGLAAAWWMLFLPAAAAVAADHGAALRLLDVRPTRFLADAIALFRPVVAAVLGPAAGRPGGA
ncbi:ferritin-like domain-containing protein [Frankia sp. Cpl3]|nr:ferritin-like domain-containing protein [Frankia sp. Cpl3]